MPEPNTSNSGNTRKNRQKQPEQRATSREKTTSQSTGQEEVRNPWFAQLGGDFSQATFERHAEVLGDGRMSHSSNVSQRAEIVQQLQRTYGNQYVQRLVDHVSRKRIEGVQTKLTVGPAGDEYEREADRVAKQVVGMPDSPARESAQRQEEEEELQMKPLQRQEEEEELQMKPLQRQEEEEELPMKTLQREIGAEGGNVGPEAEQTIQQARGSGQSLPDDVRTSMESAFGADFSGVKVHNDAESDALNESVSARAFTTGQDIFFKQGEYNPGSSSGKEVLAHELTHVVQQYGAGSPRQKWEKEDPVQMKALQRQDEEVEPPELEGTLPDGTMVDNEQFRRGPCDCRGCDASHHQRSSSLRRNGSQSRVLRRDGSGGGTPTDYNVKVGKISFDFSNPGTMAVDPYGEEDFSCAHEDAEWKTKRDKLTVKFKIDLFCKWGVDGGGNTDITSGTDAAVTADKWKDIANDLTPSKDDNWRPPRTDYWSKSLTQRHEKFHSLQDEKWAKGKGQKVVKDYLKGKTVSASDLETDLDDLLDESMDEMDSANFEWYSGGGKAYIERPGEKAAFKDGKKPYKSLAKAVKKQGKKLEKEAAD